MAKPKKQKAKLPVPTEERAPESAPAAAPLPAPAASVPPGALVRVLMKARAMGPGVCLAQGHQYDLNAKLAAALIAGGYAIEVATDSQRETR